MRLVRFRARMCLNNELVFFWSGNLLNAMLGLYMWGHGISLFETAKSHSICLMSVCAYGKSLMKMFFIFFIFFLVLFYMNTVYLNECGLWAFVTSKNCAHKK